MTREEAIDVFEGLGEVEAISLFYQRGGKADGLSIHRFPDTIQLGDAFRVRDGGWSGRRRCR